jgi:hypothetical protein
MGMRKGKIGMTIRNFLKKFELLNGEAQKNTYYYSLKNKKKRMVVVGNIKEGIVALKLNDKDLEKEKSRITKVRILERDIVIIEKNGTIIPIIQLNSRDLMKCRTKFIIIKEETKYEIKAKVLEPILFDDIKGELLVITKEMIIKKKEIILEIRINDNATYIKTKNLKFIAMR